MKRGCWYFIHLIISLQPRISLASPSYRVIVPWRFTNTKDNFFLNFYVGELLRASNIPVRLTLYKLSETCVSLGAPFILSHDNYYFSSIGISGSITCIVSLIQYNTLETHISPDAHCTLSRKLILFYRARPNRIKYSLLAYTLRFPWNANLTGALFPLSQDNYFLIIKIDQIFPYPCTLSYPWNANLNCFFYSRIGPKN